MSEEERNKTQPPVDRAKECIDTLKGLFPDIVASLYLKTYYNYNASMNLFIHMKMVFVWQRANSRTCTFLA